ncbi:FAD-dependent oxidoreductase [Georgenia thermotolerans]|uniref:Ferredoxin reductase n=1 Tax=Georgenia thermotolerans TaxID=527326 RepID=A0A7J5UMA6_9MICO|nr:FAD-dependent oxidoreductase [Georgenia thermotolerans]KAE8763505.1 ferredoxin reductase [Georgenia thermotolerans]
MRLVVDMTRCQSYAQCCFLAPGTFRLRGREALVYDGGPADAEREKVLQAAEACPVQAILVERTDDAHYGEATQGKTAPHTAPTTGGGAPGPDRPGGRIVIVGASLAGLRAAEAVRAEGFTGRLTLIGDEAAEPYDRPPLSKEVLEGMPVEHTALPRLRELDAEWKLGTPATGLDLAGKRVRLAGGEEVGFDRVLIATGTRARPWPDPAEAALAGVLTLRTREDAALLRERLAARPGRVLVIGGGFTGSEVASACRELGLPVTLVQRGPVPLYAALGAAIGAVMGEIQRDHGVDLRTGVTVAALEGEDGCLRRARLSDGSVVEADVAVVALGAVRNVEWLHGSGLAAGAWGVACDAGCRAFDLNGLVTDDVFVAGDVARFPHPMFGFEFLALEHWGNAVAQAQIAGHNMVAGQARRWPHLSVPLFWSTQFGHAVRSAGVATIADEVVITQGSVEDRAFVAAYGRRGRLVAAVTVDQSKWLDHYQRLIADGAPFPPRDAADQPDGLRPVPARMPPPVVPWRATEDATLAVTGHEPSQWQAVWRPRTPATPPPIEAQEPAP